VLLGPLPPRRLDLRPRRSPLGIGTRGNDFLELRRRLLQVFLDIKR
jgi:hypothetical protein